MPGAAAIRRILVVDDEVPIADTLSIIFSTRGYEARAAYTAESAIEIIAAWAPDVAIVDVMLPLMNGIELGIVLKQNYPKCNVLLFSGRPDTSLLLEEALKKGHNFEILSKPFHPTFILDKVEGLFTAQVEPPLTDA